MVSESTQGQNMRPNRLSHILKSSMNTVLFVNATIGFSENLFLVLHCEALMCEKLFGFYLLTIQMFIFGITNTMNTKPATMMSLLKVKK